MTINRPWQGDVYAAESGMDLKAYAEAAGKARSTLKDKVHTYRALSVAHLRHDQIRDS